MIIQRPPEKHSDTAMAAQLETIDPALRCGRVGRVVLVMMVSGLEQGEYVAQLSLI